jgi:hypothetical protein
MQFWLGILIGFNIGVPVGMGISALIREIRRARKLRELWALLGIEEVPGSGGIMRKL